MNTRQITQFTAKLEAILQSNAFANNNAKYGYNWQKATSMGLILVNSGFNDAGSKIYSIMCRFEEPEKAREVLESWGGNTYSGKCNFHEFDAESVLKVFEMFLKELI